MAAAHIPHMRLWCVVMLVLAVLTCTTPVILATQSQPARSYSFRSFVDTKTEEVKSTTEERGFDLTSKLKDLLRALKPSQEKTINKLFSKFKVGAINSNVFESAEYQKWAAAVVKASKKDPEVAEVLMISRLTTHYGDEALTKMLIASKEVSGLAISTVKLEAAQLTYWMVMEKSADDVFKLLKLDTMGGDAIASPLFKTWMSYVDKLNQKDGRIYTAIDVLTEHTGQVPLAKHFASVESNPDSNAVVKAYATKMQTLLFHNWKYRENMTPHLVAVMCSAGGWEKNGVKVMNDYEKWYKTLN